MNFNRKSALSTATCLQSVALIAALIGFAGATAAQAKSPVAAPIPPKTSEAGADVSGANDADGSDTSSTIVVTGSRIRRAELVQAEPTTSFTAQNILDRNLTNVADALNELPLFRGSVTPAGSQSSFGNGVNFINTFGLGSNRTLTLINGRRVVSSNLPSLFGPGAPGLQVDLNIIPTVLIDRVDVVSIGGAPTYGSDAIAGTVNLILKTKYNGARFQGTSGISAQHDAFLYNLSGVAGHNFADGRANLTVALSYDDIKGIRGIDRKHIRDNIGSLNNCTGPGPAPADSRLNPTIGCNNGPADGIPARILFRNLHSPFLSSGGVIRNGNTGAFSGFQFGNDGNLDPVISGTNRTGFFASGGNTYQTSDQTQVTSDLQRFSANVFATFDLTPGITLFAEGLYYKAKARELGTSPSFNTFVFDPSVSGGLSFDTATVPFLTPSARAGLLNQGITKFNISRSNEDLFDQSASSRTELKRGVVGARGEFVGLGRKLNYEVSFNYGTNTIKNYETRINQQRFINAVSLQQGANGPVCSLTPTIPVAPSQPFQPIADASCQPLNLFGFGVASPAALRYISQNTIDVAKVTQTVFNANLGGSLFDLWAGPVGFNFGYEHRTEKAAFQPDPFNVAGLGRGSAVKPTAGSFRLDEEFGELLIPLISPDNHFIFHSAEIFGRVRHVHNTVNGGFNAFAAGGKLALIPDIELRGNFTRSFRAPAITELFLPQSPTFVRPPDLCTASAINSGPAAATRLANCTAFLSAANANPGTYTLLASQASVAGISGGNPNLRNEKADSYTFGAIIRPRFIPGLTMTADYVNISIKGPIASLSTAQLASGCFDNPSFNKATPLAGNAFCQQLGFGPDGQIPNNPTNPAVRTGFVNGQSYKFSGITGVLDYVTSIKGIPGRFNIGADGLYVLRRIVDITGVAPSRSDGIVGDPVFSMQGRFNYYGDRFGFGTQINYTGQQLTSRQNRGPNPNDTREFDHYKPFVTVNANLYFRTVDAFRLNLSVTNLTNRIGQTYFGYIIPASVNDNIGRRYSISVTKDY